jgi:hypothetical protein
MDAPRFLSIASLLKNDQLHCGPFVRPAMDLLFLVLLCALLGDFRLVCPFLALRFSFSTLLACRWGILVVLFCGHDDEVLMNGCCLREQNRKIDLIYYAELGRHCLSMNRAD